MTKKKKKMIINYIVLYSFDIIEKFIMDSNAMHIFELFLIILLITHFHFKCKIIFFDCREL